MSQHILTPGAVFAGRYRITRPLKSGGMGSVYVAEHITTLQRVALKTMRPEIVASDVLQARFAQEAKVSTIINSRYVVGVTDAGVEQGLPFLVMELLSGAELGDVLNQRGALPFEQVAPILNQLAKGLDKAHAAGVVHRDLKPENVFLTRDEEDELVVKVLDFGIAKLLQGTSNTTVAGGTPTYMAPEQTKKGNLTSAVDIWAFGLIAFRALSGRQFWEADTIGELIGEILVPNYPPASSRSKISLPAGFDGFFSRCVCFDPAARFATAGEAAKAFAALGPATSADLKTLAMDLLGPAPASGARSAASLQRTELPVGTEIPASPGPLPSASGTVLGAPIDAATAQGSTQIALAGPRAVVPSAPSPSKPRAKGPPWALIGVGGLLLVGGIAFAATQLGGKTYSQSAPTSDDEDDEDTTKKGKRKKALASAEASAEPSASLPVVSASAVASAPPSAEPSASAGGRSPAPTLAEIDAVPKEVAVYGSSKLGCVTKAVREWLSVRCSKENDTGGRPTKVSITRGVPAGDGFVSTEPGATTLIVRFVEGTNATVKFRMVRQDRRPPHPLGERQAAARGVRQLLREPVHHGARSRGRTGRARTGARAQADGAVAR
ncbi:MAG: serine/threonine protein kinase [Polyangiaceae bacterium]|nr:serine/threonine protein kinase [Polyangiaceae bacterium]